MRPTSGPAGTDGADAPNPRSPHRRWRELPILIVVAVVIAVLAKSFVVQAFWIPSGSMEPTLQPGDRVLVNKFTYDFSEPHRGDVVVFEDPTNDGAPESTFAAAFGWVGDGLGLPGGDQDFIKRVIAIPGDTVRAREGAVLINGSALAEPYLRGRDTSDFGPVTIPAGTIWVMGDNRGNSDDSRTLFGPVPIEDIVGKAIVRVWPPSRAGGI